MNLNQWKSLYEFREACHGAHCDIPCSENLAVLGQPIQLGQVTLPNRIVYQPMEGCDGEGDGRIGALTRRRYLRFAEGGAGLIWFEATAVQQDGRANPRQLMLTAANLDSFRAMVEEIKETSLKKNGYAPAVIMQATHSGRYSKPEGVPAPLIAYHNPLFEQVPLPDNCILSDSQLERIGESLVHSAQLAEQAGFDGVDIKACHRYLLCELLSAYNREGRYGGSLENRIRLLLESALGAMQVCSSGFLVTTRVNVYDGFAHPYGFGMKPGAGLEMDLSEPLELLGQLKKAGMKLVDVTMGNPYVNPYVNRPFAQETEEHPLKGVERLLQGTGVLQKQMPDFPIVCSGLSYLGPWGGHGAAAMVEEGLCALAGFGRQTLAYPMLARDILTKGALDPAQCCIACGKCSQLMRAGGTPGCIVRDREVYAPLYMERCTN